MNLTKIISYLASCSTLSTLLFFPKIAEAQVRVDPIVIETKTERGQAQGVISLSNNSNQAFRARVYAQPFTYSRNGFEVVKSSPNDLTPYLTFSPRELVIQPGQTRRIRMLSRLLPSMDAGEYRAVIFTEPLKEAENSSGNSSVSISTRIGVVFYVRHGDVKPNFMVQSATYDAK
ncbi:MAG: P pilus assembly protein, chaperone PapD, partial [Nostocales cyanobacterium 94392]|nr:P pilus assembly protein, chaperone PapD [Nostocales cyanobacterium 94392]